MAESTPLPGELPSAEGPLAFTDLRITEPPDMAGGIPAITSTMAHMARAMDPGRGVALIAHLNQPGGIDCPSCAWPEPDTHRPRIEFCESGAKALANEATLKRATPELFAKQSVVELARLSDLDLDQQGRLTTPMRLDADGTHYREVSWDEAFGLIADELNALDSPNQAVFYTSGRASNEAAFLYSLFCKAFGTNNMPDCSNMCHESSGTALTEVIGIGKGTVTLEDFEHADAIFIIGQNPGTNHPRMFNVLGDAARKGCKIVSVNPLAEASLKRFNNPHEVLGLLGRGQAIATVHAQVRINGDLAFITAVMKAMWEAEQARPGTVFDHAFIAEYTTGYDALVASLEAADWSELLALAGVERAVVDEVAAIAIQAKRLIICWAMGITQHKNAVATIQAVTNLALLGGHIGRPGAGLCPVRGHSNVQGDRTMGVFEKPAEPLLAALDKEFGLQCPRAHGLDTVHAIEAMYAGQARVFFGLGGNFLSATPDTVYTAQAMRSCRLTVHVSTKLNRSHLVTGRQALILPCLGRTEIDHQATGPQFVTTENSMGVIQRSVGKLEPASPHLLSETMIVARMAASTLGSRSTIPWLELAGNYDALRERIERVIPGFRDYNRRVRVDGGFYLPNPPRDKRVFETDDGKAHLTVHPVTAAQVEPGQLLLATIRSHDQFNTTIYGLDDRYRGIYNERRVIFMNREDMAARGLKERQVVDITSHYEGQERHAPRFMVVPYDLPPGCTAAYFPETNVLVPVRSMADGSNQPTSKSIVVTVKPSPQPA